MNADQIAALEAIVRTAKVVGRCESWQFYHAGDQHERTAAFRDKLAAQITAFHLSFPNMTE